jgi:2-amino-4-hydroxy-6-hydroxymethyldihydropteridine diphosphokinase
MNEVIILVGSNIRPQANIYKCLKLMKEELNISSYSRIWITQSYGNDGPDFLNLAIAATTKLDAEAIKTSIINKIETNLGRIRYPDKYAPRTIDLDIMVFNNVIIDSDIWDKVFMAIPISELKPDLRNPKNYETLFEVAKKLKSSHHTELFSPPIDFFPN